MTLAPMTSPLAPTPVWQEPFVEVVRYGLSHRTVGLMHVGDVEQMTDPQIRKSVFRIRGAVAATNYLRIPRELPHGSPGLGLTGRYVYIQLRGVRGQHVTLHLDLLTSKKTSLRFSFSSMFATTRSTGTVLRVPFDLRPNWTTVVVDMAEMLGLHTFNGYDREAYRHLKAVTCCAAMSLRNVFTSATLYDATTLPAALALGAARDNQAGPFSWLTLPVGAFCGPDASSPRRSPRKQPTRSPPVGGGVNNQREAAEPLSPWDSPPESPRGHGAAVVVPMPSDASSVRAPRPAPSEGEDAGRGVSPPLSPSTRETNMRRDRHEVLSRADQILRQAGFAVSPRHNDAATVTATADDDDAGAAYDEGARRRRLTMLLSTDSPSRAQQNPPRPSTWRRRSLTFVSPRRLLASEHSDWPDPILELTRLIGFNCAFPRPLHWAPSGRGCIYSHHSTIVLREFPGADAEPPTRSSASGRSQSPTLLATDGAASSSESDNDDHETYLTGHAGEITALALSSDGAWLVSAERSATPAIRLWDLAERTCRTVVRAPTRQVQALAFSPDGRALCCVGPDAQARTVIYVWDCGAFTHAPPRGQPTAPAPVAPRLVLRARQTCDFAIHAIAFAPYDSDQQQQQHQLVSCGRENIRFWRIHPTQRYLPGAPVILREYARETTFTALAFDGLYPRFPTNLARFRPVYAATSRGTLLVLDYDSRQVVCVYRLHDAAIHALAVNEGFCVTGAADGFLRVWPLDFTDFFLEAQHDAAVGGVDVSADGMRVLVGGTHGAIGVLDLATQRYRTLLRAHTETVGALAALPAPDPNEPPTVLTSAADGTLRVWDVRAGRQTMEFDVAQDPVTCMSPRPETGAGDRLVAVGFVSGCTRIFNLGPRGAVADDHDDANDHRPGDHETSATPTHVLKEFQQHQSPLCDVQYRHDGSALLTLARGHQLCLHDVAKDYAPIKMLLVDTDPDDPSLRLHLSPDGRFVAVLQRGRRGVLLLDAAALCVIATIAAPGPQRATTLSTTSHHVTPSPSPTEPRERPPLLTALAISPDSQELLALSQGDRLFAFALGESSLGGSVGRLLRSTPLLGQGGITVFAQSPNQRYVATGGADGSVRVWQAALAGPAQQHRPARMYQSFLLHAGGGAISNLVFTGDGAAVVATCATSSAVFIWRFRGVTGSRPSMVGLELAPAALDDDVVTVAKTGFQLPLVPAPDTDNDVDVGLQTPAKTPARPEPVTCVPLRLSSSRVVQLQWSRVFRHGGAGRAQFQSSAPPFVWSPPLGLIGFAVGAWLVVEELDSGRQHPWRDHGDSELIRLGLSPDHSLVVSVAASLDTAVIRDLAALRRPRPHPVSNQHDENQQPNGDGNEDDARRVLGLPHGLVRLHDVQLSTDNRRLVLSCDRLDPSTRTNRRRLALLVLNTDSGATIYAHEGLDRRVLRVWSLGPRSTLLLAVDGEGGSNDNNVKTSPLQRLELDVDGECEGGAAAQTLSVATALPSSVACACIRRKNDDGHSVLAVVVDGDGRCVFLDVSGAGDGGVVARCRLVLPDAQPSRRLRPLRLPPTEHEDDGHDKGPILTGLEWIAARNWEALVGIVGRGGAALAVFPLPLRKATSTTTLTAPDWASIAQRRGLTCVRLVAFEAPIVRVLVDPMGDVALVLTADGARVTAHLRTGQCRVLVAASPSLGPSPPVRLALDGALLLGPSTTGETIRLWETSTGHEIGRLAAAPGSVCQALDVSPMPVATITGTDDDNGDRDRARQLVGSGRGGGGGGLALAGYSDGAVRLFDLLGMAVVAQFTMPSPAPSGRSRTRPPATADRRHSVAMSPSPTQSQDDSALRTLRQRAKWALAPTPHKPEPSPNARDRGVAAAAATEGRGGGDHDGRRGIRSLGFLSRTTAIVVYAAISNDDRNNAVESPLARCVALVDFSEVLAPNIESTATQSTKAKATAKAQTRASRWRTTPRAPEVQYREIALPMATSSGRQWTEIVAIAVAPRSPTADEDADPDADDDNNQQPPRERGDNDEDPEATRGFLVVAAHGDDSCAVHVFAGSGRGPVRSHPVHRDDELAPIDSWALRSSTPPSVVFHPRDPTLLLALTRQAPTPRGHGDDDDDDDDDNDDDDDAVAGGGEWFIDLRDTAQRRTLRRLSLAAVAIDEPATLQRALVHGVPTVLLVDAHGNGAVVDVDGKVLIPLAPSDHGLKIVGTSSVDGLGRRATSTLGIVETDASAATLVLGELVVRGRT